MINELRSKAENLKSKNLITKYEKQLIKKKYN